MPRILIDNTPPTFVFQDGNQLTDGMANFGRALVQAPLAAAQIRQDQQQQELANTWRQAEIDRQYRQDDLNRVWHDQNQKRQAEQDAIARAGMGLPVEGRTDLQPLVDEANQTRNFNQSYRQALTNEANARAFWMSPIGKAIGGLFGSGKNGASGGSDRPTAATLKAAHELADAEALRRGVVEYDEMGKRVVKDPAGWNTILKQSYELHGIKVPQGWQDVPDKGAPAANGQTLPATPGASTGWPLVPTAAGGAALGVGGVFAGKKIAEALAARGAAAAAPAAAAPAAGAVGRVFSAARPVLAGAGRVAGALASAPVAIGTAGAYGAYEANKATRADLNPVDGTALDVLKAYADGKSIDPGWVTKFGKAITTVPTWMGGTGERTGEALDRIQGQHVQELVQALATAIPEGDPNKARILAQVQQDAWQNPARAQQLVAAIYNNLAAQPSGN